MAGDAIVQTDHHHSAPSGSFLIKLVELILERLLISGRIPALEWKGNDVVHVERVWHRDKVATLDWDNEGFVPACFLEVIGEAEAF